MEDQGPYSQLHEEHLPQVDICHLRDLISCCEQNRPGFKLRAAPLFAGTLQAAMSRVSTI